MSASVAMNKCSYTSLIWVPEHDGVNTHQQQHSDFHLRNLMHKKLPFYSKIFLNRNYLCLRAHLSSIRIPTSKWQVTVGS